MKKLLVVLAGLTVAGCTSTPQLSKASTKLGDLPLSVTYVHGRSLDFEPCGCSFHPTGGIVREWNLLSRWRADSTREWLHLTGGNTFHLSTPSPIKAKAMVRALNQLGTLAVGLGPKDFDLPTDLLQEIASLAEFKFLSTNVVEKESGKAPFERVVWLNWGSHRVAVVSAVELAENARWKSLPLVESIQAALENTQPHILVVLSSLNETARQAMLRKLSGKVVVFGGDEEDKKPFSIDQWSASTLFQQPPDRGRSVARLDIEPSEGSGFWNPQVAADYKASIPGWVKGAKLLAAQVESAQSDARKYKNLVDSYENLRDAIARAKTFTAVDSGIVYEGNIFSLTSEFDEPSNPMSGLAREVAEAVRQAAIAAPGTAVAAGH